MKINWKRVLRMAGRLIRAAPAIADAIGPVTAKRRRPEPKGPTPARPSEPTRDRPRLELES